MTCIFIGLSEYKQHLRYGKNKIKQNVMKNESNHLTKNATFLTLGKLTAKKIYSILISALKNKPISQSYVEN